MKLFGGLRRTRDVKDEDRVVETTGGAGEASCVGVNSFPDDIVAAVGERKKEGKAQKAKSLLSEYARKLLHTTPISAVMERKCNLPAAVWKELELTFNKP